MPEITPSAPLILSDVIEAVEFVSASQFHEFQAYICNRTGRILCMDEGLGSEDTAELPDDPVAASFVAVPHKHGLDLGKPLALNFVADELPALLSEAGAQAEIASISGMQDIKEIGATKTTFASNLSAIADNEHLADDVRARYEKSSAEEQKMLKLAIGNLAIGVARNLVLAKQAPEAVKSVGSKPMMVTRVGQLTLAGELVGMQAKGLSGIATKLPALLSAVKIKAPAAPETTEPQSIVL
jgi:hypothetical protein